MTSKELLVWVPATVLALSGFASVVISQYQIGELVDGQKDLAETQSAIVVNQAVTSNRLDNLEKL